MKRRLSEDNDMRSISRADSKKVNGWLVRMFYKKGKPKIQKWFIDTTYGGKNKALLAAKQFRDKKEAENPNYCITGYRTTPTIKSTTGIPGVLRNIEYSHGKPVEDSYRWIATWFEDGKLRTRSFSENKYGYFQAKLLAVTTRREELENQNVEWAFRDNDSF